MKKSTKTKVFIFTPIAVILAALITFFVIDRFFWMHFDYYFCAKPEEVSCYVYEVTDKTATLWLHQRSSAAFDRYGGSAYYEKDGVIYVGINVIYFFGERFQNPTEIKIEAKEKIEKIVLKGHGKTKVIYPSQTEQY